LLPNSGPFLRTRIDRRLLRRPGPEAALAITRPVAWGTIVRDERAIGVKRDGLVPVLPPSREIFGRDGRIELVAVPAVPLTIRTDEQEALDYQYTGGRQERARSSMSPSAKG